MKRRFGLFIGKKSTNTTPSMPMNTAPGNDASKKKEIALSLGKTIGIQQIYAIKKYLDDPDVEVRRAAISSLEQQWPTGDSFGLFFLKDALKDPDAEVRAVTALAIGEFIPQAKTDLAVKMGQEAVSELLKLLRTESSENVLSQIFVALANINNPAILSPFQEAAGQLDLPALLVGIKQINLLQSTTTRKEMSAILQTLVEKKK